MSYDPAGPPIIPGNSEPFTLATMMPAPTPVKPPRPGWVVPVVAGLVVLLLVSLGGVGYLLYARDAGDGSAAGPAATLRQNIPTALNTAYTKCGAVGQLSDGDKTLFLDMYGDKTGSGTTSSRDLTCVLASLQTPQFIITEMSQTRALDGRLSDKWSTFEASWTYHPDNGLDVLIRDVS